MILLGWLKGHCGEIAQWLTCSQLFLLVIEFEVDMAAAAVIELVADEADTEAAAWDRCLPTAIPTGILLFFSRSVWEVSWLVFRREASE